MVDLKKYHQLIIESSGPPMREIDVISIVTLKKMRSKVHREQDDDYNPRFQKSLTYIYLEPGIDKPRVKVWFLLNSKYAMPFITDGSKYYRCDYLYSHNIRAKPKSIKMFNAPAFFWIGKSQQGYINPEDIEPTKIAIQKWLRNNIAV